MWKDRAGKQGKMKLKIKWASITEALKSEEEGLDLVLFGWGWGNGGRMRGRG